MVLQNDKYDFSQPSLTGKPGFECFENNKAFYFHLNDETGKPLLYGQKYQFAKSRDACIKSVVTNISKPERIVQQKTDDGKHFFVLRAGNKQEIARSRLFNNREEIGRAINWLSSVGKTTPVHRFSKTVNTEPAKTAKKQDKIKLAEKLPKYSFRIDWYPESKSGKIEHVLSGAAKNFQGVDEMAILAFINSYLQKEAVERVAPDTKEAPATANTESAFPEEKIKNLVLKVSGKELKGSILAKPEHFNVEIDLQHLLKEEEKSCNAMIVAKSLKTFNQVPIGSARIQPPYTKLSVPVSAGNLSPGPYRLIARVTLSNDNNIAMEGSRLVQVM